MAVFDSGLQFLKGILADDMFDPAGLFNGGGLFHAEIHEDLTDDDVPFVDPFGDLPPGRGQVDLTARVDRDQSVLQQLFHRDADARFGKVHFPGDVDRADSPLFSFDHQDHLHHDNISKLL